MLQFFFFLLFTLCLLLIASCWLLAANCFCDSPITIVVYLQLYLLFHNYIVNPHMNPRRGYTLGNMKNNNHDEIVS